MNRDEQITRSIQNFDKYLFCKKDFDGIRKIYRKSKRLETFEVERGILLSYVRYEPHLIFCLTDDWSPRGVPVSWGIDNIRNRLHMIDSHNRNYFEEMMKQNEKIDESRKRSFNNNVESFMYDFRSEFKKATNDIVVSESTKF